MPRRGKPGTRKQVPSGSCAKAVPGKDGKRRKGQTAWKLTNARSKRTVDALLREAWRRLARTRASNALARSARAKR